MTNQELIERIINGKTPYCSFRSGQATVAMYSVFTQDCTLLEVTIRDDGARVYRKLVCTETGSLPDLDTPENDDDPDPWNLYK